MAASAARAEPNVVVVVFISYFPSDGSLVGIFRRDGGKPWWVDVAGSALFFLLLNFLAAQSV
jgi:hypothetical protein